MLILRCVSREGPCKKSHVLKLNTTGKFALNIVDNLVVVHHQSTQVSWVWVWVWVWVEMDVSLSVFSVCLCVGVCVFQTSLIYDIHLREPDCALNTHQPVLPARSIHPYRIPLTGRQTDGQHLLSFNFFLSWDKCVNLKMY